MVIDIQLSTFSNVKCNIFDTHESPAKLLKYILSKWDTGGTQKRLRILRDFIITYQTFTGPDIDKSFGNGTSLFLARLSTWMRMNYAADSANGIELVLRALRVLVGANSGHRFLKEFADVGNVAAIVDILTITTIEIAAKIESLDLLLCIVNGGRVYKELVCKLNGAEVVSAVILYNDNRILRKFALQLLTVMGQGNPKYLERVLQSLAVTLMKKIDVVKNSYASEMIEEYSNINDCLSKTGTSGRKVEEHSSTNVMFTDMKLNETFESHSIVTMLFRQGSQVLRHILVDNKALYPVLRSSCLASVVKAAIIMLRSEDHQVIYEATQLLTEVYGSGRRSLAFQNDRNSSDTSHQISDIKGYIISELTSALVNREVVDIAYTEHATDSDESNRHYIAHEHERDMLPSVSAKATSTRPSTQSLSHHPSVLMQSNCAKAIIDIIQKHQEMLHEDDQMIHMNSSSSHVFNDEALVSNLIVCFGNELSDESQKHGSSALHELLRILQDETKSTITAIFNSNVGTGGDAFYKHIAIHNVSDMSGLKNELAFCLRKCISNIVKQFKIEEDC